MRTGFNIKYDKKIIELLRSFMKVSKYDPQINLVLNSGIDFSSFGWVNKVADILNIRYGHVSEWMKRYMPDFYNKCYKRNSPNTVNTAVNVSVKPKKIVSKKEKEPENLELQQKRRKLIIDSIDFTKRTWFGNMQIILELDIESTYRWIRKFMPELYKNNK